MPKVSPATHVEDGAVIVRVGADAVNCPLGANHSIYPVIQLVWPFSEQDPYPHGDLSIRWQDKIDSTRPSKSLTPKFIGLVTPQGNQWIGYRVSDKDRELFESLRKQWGMWFLRVGQQGDEQDRCWTFFNEGGFMAGSVMEHVPTLAQTMDESALKKSLVRAWDDTLDAIRKTRPALLPDQEAIRHRFVALSKIPSILEKLGGGKLPWKPSELPHWGKPDNKAHDYVVSNYLTLLRATKENATKKEVSEKFRRECGEMYALLRQARIFEITPESYMTLHVAVDKYVTEDIAQLTFHDPRDGRVDVPAEEGELLYRRQSEACSKLPFPDKLPFGVCWLAMSGLVVLSSVQAASRALPEHDGPYALMGILVSADGEHHELLVSKQVSQAGQSNGMNISVSISTHHVEEQPAWQHKFCLAPFVLHAIVDCINEHQTTIIAQRKLGMQSQSRIKRGMGDLGLKNQPPPPFYTVHLRDKVIQEVAKGWSGGKLRAQLGHRFDVRGHWCFKIYRGEMPMDVEMELHLDKRGYSIFKSKELDDVTLEAMQQRDLPPRQPNEWIATKRFWKNSYVKGPEDAEYVPSTRRATKGMLAFDNER